MASQHVKVGLLNSWKEIAAYLDRGVRTVQRWEKQGLPVRRVTSGPRSPVIAKASDIDAWIESARAHGVPVLLSHEHVMLRGQLRISVEQSRALCIEMAHLREGQRNGMTKLLATIAALERSCKHDRAQRPSGRVLPLSPFRRIPPAENSQSGLQQAS